MEFRKEPTDVTALIKDIMDLLHPGGAEKGLHLLLDLPEALPANLLVDPHRVRQIMMNLVGNALKFTDAGGVSVGVSHDAATNILRVEVADTGPGISPDGQAKLFQRFSQVDGSSTRRHGGSGLGLAICRGLVEALGGTIGVDSRPGDGARFWFAIPAKIATASPGSGHVHATSSLWLDGVRILVADDSAAIREILERLLLAAGAEVTLVADGEAALAAASARPYDLVLLDQMMPRLDGVSAARAIRQPDALNAEIPLLAMSAFTGNPLPPGLFDAVIAKPLEIAALLRGISGILNIRGEIADAA